MTVEADLELRISDNPGDPAFAELADVYRRRGDYQGAFDLCLNGLTANPACIRGRVVLARLFYERLHFPFAARELREVCTTLPANPYARKLLEALSPENALSPASVELGKVLAEVEFNFNSLDLSERDS